MENGITTLTPLTLAALTRNAYRTLGLTADATQAQVDSAARSLRLWDDPAQVPATANDAAFLGPVKRARQEIESAVSRLADPETRVEERLWWFCRTPPENDAPLKSSARDALARHDAALAAAHHLLIQQADDRNLAGWSALIETCRDLAANGEYHRWLLAVENGGEYEKSANPRETVEAQQRMMWRAAGALAASVDTAMNAHELAEADLGAWCRQPPLAHAGQAVRILQSACAATGTDFQHAWTGENPAEQLLGRMEDALARRCDAGRASIHTAWKSKRIDVLKPACDRAAGAFQALLGPMAQELAKLSADDPDRTLRVRQCAAAFLSYVADGYEGAYHFAGVEAVLKMCLPYAEQTPLESRVRQRLRAVPAQAKQRRAAVRKARVKRAFSPRRLFIVPVLIIFAIFRALSSMNTQTPDEDVPRHPPQMQWNLPDDPNFQESLKHRRVFNEDANRQTQNAGTPGTPGFPPIQHLDTRPPAPF